VASFLDFVVKFVPFTLAIDRQGRIVLPKEVRRALDVTENSELVCRVVGSRIAIERFSESRIQEAFSRLEDIAPSLDLDVVDVEGEDKYVDREYALRKIGLRSGS